MITSLLFAVAFSTLWGIVATQPRVRYGNQVMFRTNRNLVISGAGTIAAVSTKPFLYKAEGEGSSDIDGTAEGPPQLGRPRYRFSYHGEVSSGTFLREGVAYKVDFSVISQDDSLVMVTILEPSDKYLSWTMIFLCGFTVWSVAMAAFGVAFNDKKQ